MRTLAIAALLAACSGNGVAPTTVTPPTVHEIAIGDTWTGEFYGDDVFGSARVTVTDDAPWTLLIELDDQAPQEPTDAIRSVVPVSTAVEVFRPDPFLLIAPGCVGELFTRNTRLVVQFGDLWLETAR